MALRDTPIPVTACPHCGRALEASLSCPENSQAVPTPGALSVCIGCAGLAVFTDVLGLRPLTYAEFSELDIATKLALTKAQSAVRHLRRGLN